MNAVGAENLLPNMVTGMNAVGAENLLPLHGHWNEPLRLTAMGAGERSQIKLLKFKKLQPITDI
jgi:hypothetical protein